MWVPPDPVPPGVAHMTSLVTFALALRLVRACLPSRTWAALRAAALARPGIMASIREAAHPVEMYHGRLRARLPGCELVGIPRTGAVAIGTPNRSHHLRTVMLLVPSNAAISLTLTTRGGSIA